MDNKRLAVDLSALKQLIWDNCDDCDEEVHGSKRDLSLLFNEHDEFLPIY